MKSSARILTIFFSFFIGVTSFSLYAQEADGLEGRWNLTISQVGKELPSWLEISHSGNNTLIGRFTGMTGGVLNNNEAEPGPIMIQGDHGAIEFRKLELTPME